MISRFMVAALCVLGPLTAGAAMQGFLGHADGRIVTALGSGQSPPNVGQESGSSPCSNIVAIAGVTVNCSNLTPQPAEDDRSDSWAPQENAHESIRSRCGERGAGPDQEAHG